MTEAAATIRPRVPITEISFERTYDPEVIRQIVTHPQNYCWVSDDFSPASDRWTPPLGESVWWVLAKEGKDEILGIFLLVFESPILAHVHCAFLPGARGARARKAALAGLEWLWQNTKCLRLVASIPGWNKPAVHFARFIGMEVYGANRSSCLKDGKLWAQILMGLTRNPKREVH